MYISSQEESTNSDTSSDGSFFEMAGIAAAAIAGYEAARYSEQAPLATPHPPQIPQVTGRQWVELNLDDPARCKHNFRMLPADFMHLHAMLVAHHGLQSTQQFDGVEALGMFIWACGTGQSFRTIRDRFDRSVATISTKIGQMLDCMLSFAHTVIRPSDPTYSHLHPGLHRYAPYFDGCIGAIDGTHIPARINHSSRMDFINRKGWASFNVLAIVDLDMRFTYVGAGMAGSCHDQAVLRECMKTPNYPHPPPGKYYLVDSGYAVRDGYLGAYRRTRYHLEEFRNRGAETTEENFNYHHASIRNVVERAFGVLKGRWHILKEIPFYGRAKQPKIVIACCALHNYLVELGLARQPNPPMSRPPAIESTLWVAAHVSEDMSRVRDWIALGVSCM